MDTPSFKEDHISQIPALQLLMNLGYSYLSPADALDKRGGKKSGVILEDILEERLREINRIFFKGKEYRFSIPNIRTAIQTLKDVPFDGLVRTNEKIYDLLTMGKSLEQTIDGDTKSFTLNFIDWKRPENNVFHVSEEFEVERTGSYATRRPDIVLFVNGIPFGVIECKRPDIKDALEQAVSQQIRNQRDREIPKLFIYSQLVMAAAKNEAKYATAGTAAKFWSVWREAGLDEAELLRLVNKPLRGDQKQRLFSDRFSYVRDYFDALEQAGGRELTEQDKAIYCLCRPRRLLELAYQFVVFDAGEKKVARYQQYFAVKKTIERVAKVGDTGRRTGGVIWHTQGSGKSLTMVMLAKALALEPSISNPRIVLVTDRIDLDDQIYRTFHQCGKDPVKARTGQHLIDLVTTPKDAVITTVIDKFQAAVKQRSVKNESGDVFILVDESHRSQYGISHAQMQQVFPNACYIGFTGTPLMKKEKNTAQKFGGLIDTYTIDQAVRDKSVVPRLYEGRLAEQDVARESIDRWFQRVSEGLTDEQTKDLKKKFSTADQLNRTEQKIKQVAYDISAHFAKTWQGTGFKAQLAAPSKLAALKYKEYLDEFGLVSSEVLISGPDAREGYEDVYDEPKAEVQKFWKKMMDKYGSEKDYQDQLINAFKNGDRPEIIIVVDKLLTGFDAPRNVVLYLTRKMTDHSLLQAIARVNRLYEGKDFGYIVDYYGILGELDQALTKYSALSEFQQDEIEMALCNVTDEVKTLPQKHSDLWDIFNGIKNKYDEEAYERHLADEPLRHRYYDRLSTFARTLEIALSTARFLTDTPAEKIKKYKTDLKFFMNLRSSARRRYAESIDFKEYEARIKKLLDTYVTSDEIVQITPLVDIFDKEKFQAEVESIVGKAAKADMIASQTRRTITAKMDEDPAFYKKFSKLLEETIRDYRNKRVSDAEYLNRAQEIMESVRNRTGDELPAKIRNEGVARAFYGVVHEALESRGGDGFNARDVSADLGIKIDEIVRANKIVAWPDNEDVKNKMRNEIEDVLVETNEKYKLDLDYDAIDSIMERALDVARARYADG
ncbi:MAG: restriction endonuclease subunit R [Candidatus Lindowbacteria bacterium RIFCSPLOWO2_12_FULL_62_27]|nr:MAG: restriction endonuclease subunit R [Candidatus Lindowbacteria bacterium RIFCSPLOWO2_02_FULL_62_12]OGH59046.1 MAG: restriction endonuclease subunit R [Candidatus Lindowbacteria bacterium RIFCSPLOWO2_12_FULL_62_27]